MQSRLLLGQTLEVFSIGRQLLAEAPQCRFRMFRLIPDRPGDAHEVGQIGFELPGQLDLVHGDENVGSSCHARITTSRPQCSGGPENIASLSGTIDHRSPLSTVSPLHLACWPHRTQGQDQDANTSPRGELDHFLLNIGGLYASGRLMADRADAPATDRRLDTAGTAATAE